MESETAGSGGGDALRTIAATPPSVPEEVIRTVLLDEYGLEGDLHTLVSERDQNCVLTNRQGERFVLKIANAAEDPVVTDFQVRALLHLESKACGVLTPGIVQTREGAASTRISSGASRHVCRVVTFLAGRPVGDQPVDERIAFDIGAALAKLHIALADFCHAGDCQPLLWDMQRALELRPLLIHITDPDMRAAIGACLDEFEEYSLPYLCSSKRQVIHGDLNPGNILIAGDGSSIAGIIDFGDMVRAPAVVDLAIAASYLRKDDVEPLALIAAAVAGYDSIKRISQDQLGLLHGLIRTRLATSITLLQWRLSVRGDGDAYSEASASSEDDAARFFALLGAIGERRFGTRLVAAIAR